MNWLQKIGFVNAQQILEQVAQGIIPPEMAAQQLQGVDVCGMMDLMNGNLRILSQIMGCQSVEEGLQFDSPAPEMNNENNEEMI